MASRLDEGRFAKHQCGVTLFMIVFRTPADPRSLQIGDLPEATEFLRSLDDDLEDQHGVRDIVDARAFEGEMDAAFLLCAAMVLGDADLRRRVLLGCARLDAGDTDACRSVNKRLDAEA